MCLSLVLIKLQAAWNFLKKRFKHRCFPLNIAKILRTPILKNTPEQLLLDIPTTTHYI